MNERAEFEEAMSSPRGEYMPTAFKVGSIDGPYLNDFVQAAWEGWQARAALASSPSQPEGWKLVPLSLTDEMMGAFSYGLERFVRDRAPAADMTTIRANYQEAWEYLLAAVPERT